MQPAIGSVRVHLQLKGNRTTEWIDVHPSIPLPLLSYKACRKLSIIPERFPRPIVQVTYARVSQGDQCNPSGTASDNRDIPTDISTCQDQQPPFTTSTTPAQARDYFLRTYKDVLVRKEDLPSTLLRPIQGPKMKIHLKENVQPFAVHTPRQIPLAYQKDVKKELLDMEAQNIIAPAGDDPSDWCHPLFAVPKSNGGVRITHHNGPVKV